MYLVSMSLALARSSCTVSVYYIYEKYEDFVYLTKEKCNFIVRQKQSNVFKVILAYVTSI